MKLISQDLELIQEEELLDDDTEGNIHQIKSDSGEDLDGEESDEYK